MKAGRALSKAEFIERVASWAAKHNARFDKGRLDEWIKQGLAFKAKPGPNRGKRRTFIYGCRHYRRALQLMRFHVSGIRDTDEFFVQLFIRGYGVRPHEVREPLRKEFSKARAKLNAQLRSTYADNEDKIPLGRKGQFLRSFGELDGRFRKAKMVFPEHLLIAAARAARLPVSRESSQMIENSAERQSEDPLNIFLNMFLGGMLQHGDDSETEMERLIRVSNEDQYEAAKIIFHWMRSCFRVPESPENSAAAALRAIDTAFSMRELAAFMLVMALKIVRIID